jgi:hypothetical protein
MPKIVCEYKQDSRKIELYEFALPYVYDTTLSNPPTSAELSDMWELPTELKKGFTFYLCTGQNLYLIMTDATYWWYEELATAT